MRAASVHTQIQTIITHFAKRAFGAALPSVSPPLTQSKESDFASNISSEIYKYHRDLQFKHIEPGVTPKSLAQEIIDLLQHTKQQLNIYSDEFGSLQIGLKDGFLEKHINTALEKDTLELIPIESYQKNQLQPKSEKIGFVYPIMDLLEQPTMDQYRQSVVLESVARVNEYLLNNQVKRVHILNNNLPFHGIVLGYLAEQKTKNKNSKNGSVMDMSSIAKYIQSKGLKTSEDLMNFGTLTLGQTSVDHNMGELFDELYNLAAQKRSLIYQDLDKNIQYLHSFKMRTRTVPEILASIIEKGILSGYPLVLTTCLLFQTNTFLSQMKKDIVPRVRLLPVNTVQDNPDMITLLTKLSNLTKQRLINNLPELEAQVVETGLEKRWLKYYINLFDRKQHFRVNQQEIVDLMFTKGEERKQIYLKEERCIKTGYKIRSHIDRKIGKLFLEVGRQLEEYNLSGARHTIDRMQTLLKGNPSYANTKMVRLCLECLYKVSGVI